MNSKDDQADRLAAALRENLRRRKTQARAADAPPSPPLSPPAPDDLLQEDGLKR